MNLIGRLAEDMATQPEPVRALERHVQSVLLTLAVVGIVYIGSISVSGQIHLAQIDERITATQAQIAALQTQIAATYRTEDAKRDTAETAGQLAELKHRVESLEQRFATSARSTKGLEEWRRQ